MVLAGPSCLLECSEAARTPFAADFPRVVVHQRSASLVRLKSEGYAAAKRGDADAAARIACRSVDPRALERIRQIVDGTAPIVVGVYGSNGNALPAAFAAVVAAALKLEVDTSIVQANRACRTGADGLERLMLRQRFSGIVKPGRAYMIVDDVVTQGGTIADLRGFIEGRGGQVICATTVVSAHRSQVLPISSATLVGLRRHAIEFEGFWRSTFGYDFSALTQSEGRALCYASRRQPDRLRTAIAAIQEGGDHRTRSGAGRHVD